MFTKTVRLYLLFFFMIGSVPLLIVTHVTAQEKPTAQTAERTPQQPFIFYDKLIAADFQSNSEFGTAVILTRNNQYLIVSAPLQTVNGNASQGKVYIFRRNDQERWIQVQTLTASDGSAGDRFGHSLDLADNNTLIIGAPHDDSGSDANLGSAYIFSFRNGRWQQQGKLVAADSFAFSGDKRGTAVALTPDGNTAFVGAPGVERGSGTNPGVVYQFDRAGSDWSQTDILVGPTTRSGSFGLGLATSGNGAVLAIGGLYSDNPIINKGRVYLYEQTGGSWEQSQTLTPTETAEQDEFGKDITFNQDGSVLVIGAAHEAVSTPGKVYIFIKGGDSWQQQQKLTIPSGSENGHFGASVAVDNSGDQIVIGAWLNDSGAIHRYRRVGTQWRYQQTLATVDERQEQLGFGVALSADGAILAGGARFAHTNSSIYNEIGAVYTFGEGHFAYIPFTTR